jgi:hypothetical protein
LKQTVFVLTLLLLFSSTDSFAQTRKRSTTTRTPAPAKTNVAFQQGANNVAGQIKTLTKFIYLLGGAANLIEQNDAAMRRNQASPAQIEQLNSQKATLRSSLQGVREGLDKLEIQFRTTPELQRYYINLAGVASGAVNAEELASAGQYDRSGRALLDVVNRLTDVLLAMK